MRYFLFLILACNSWHSAAQEVIPTKGGKLKIFPILHSSMILEWQDQTIMIDPYGGSALYQDHAPNLILITDIHGDHYHKETLEGLELDNAQIIAPIAVVELMDKEMAAKALPLANDSTISWKGIQITGVPMYNLPETEDSRHPKGRGNGYILEIDGIKIYISGDTEDIPEMRNLKAVDIAFVCMNLPYTMDVEQAAAAVVDFQPAVVYPFHYRGGGGKFSDVEKFKTLVTAAGKNIEVRIRNWYQN